MITNITIHPDNKFKEFYEIEWFNNEYVFNLFPFGGDKLMAEFNCEGLYQIDFNEVGWFKI